MKPFESKIKTIARLAVCLSLLSAELTIANPFSLFKTATAGVLAAAPPEQEVVQLSRDMGSPLILESNLSKNMYRQEPYEAEYTESVPYETTENYYESVPYEVDEAYEDTEYYTDYENVCRDVPYQERTCRNEQECTGGRRERRCTTTPVCGHGRLDKYLLGFIEMAHARPGRGGGNGPDDGSSGGGPSLGDDSARRDEERRRNEEENRRRGDEERRRGDEERRRGEEEGRRRGDEERRRGEEERRRGEEEGRRRGEEERRRRDEDEGRRRGDEERRRGEEERRRRDDEERRRCRNVEKCEEVEVEPGGCRTVERCRNQTRYRNECRMENVTKSRTVTKYRRVTKYRDELRQRTVTRYREVTRCCVTRYRDVFDHQLQVKTLLIFPAETALVGNETEKFKISLAGDDANPQIKVSVISSVFGYAPEVKYLGGNQFQVHMNLKAKLSAKDFGKDKISALAVIADGTSNFIQVRDLGTRSRFVTTYEAKVLDAKTNAVLAIAAWQTLSEQRNHEVKLTTAAGEAGTALLIKPATKIKIALKVQRSSLLLDQPVSFESTAAGTVAKALEYDTKPFLDSKLVGKIVVTGKLAAAVLSFVDSTKNNAEVVSRYTISVSTMDGTLIGSSVHARKDLKADTSGRYKLALKKDMGFAADKLALLKTGAEISVDMEIERSGRRFTPNPSTLTKKQTQKLK